MAIHAPAADRMEPHMADLAFLLILAGLYGLTHLIVWAIARLGALE